MRIEIFTDGACSGNPGRGGFGVIMRVPQKNYEKVFSEGFRLTTNNRMELLAVIVALEKLKSDEHEVHIFTDSKYVADAVNQKWIDNWVKKGFKNVKNPDLWQKFIPLYRKFQPQFHWIKGHAGHPENERADQLAVVASQKNDLKIDQFFENQNQGLF
ncbi:MAG: ribonuclease HI [Flavobacteriaceae bacterium]|nr:ribonuclease HI [Flavobacteriaceae bacterium]